MTAKKRAKPKAPAMTRTELLRRARQKAEPPHTVVLVQGVEGPSVYINGYRIVGSKPWGGGPILARWECSDEDMKRAIAERDAKVKP